MGSQSRRAAKGRAAGYGDRRGKYRALRQFNVERDAFVIPLSAAQTSVDLTSAIRHGPHISLVAPGSSGSGTVRATDHVDRVLSGMRALTSPAAPRSALVP
jgi:hypothetical protein